MIEALAQVVSLILDQTGRRHPWALPLMVCSVVVIAMVCAWLLHTHNP